MSLDAPFPWFGGKRRIAALVWHRFGAVSNYVEPFFGSGAVLLGRPAPWVGSETVNDLDGYVANFWRAVRADPAAVAHWADWPVNENDLHARHIWLLDRRETLHAQLEGDPDYCDVRIAGYWVWGLSCWIGDGFCSGVGPWRVNGDRQLVRETGGGIERKRVNLRNEGMGVHRTTVRRKLPHLGDTGRGVHRDAGVAAWFARLADRLRFVRVCSGDWQRVCGPAVTVNHDQHGGVTGVLLDPPYAGARDLGLYRQDSRRVAHDVRDWAVAHGDDPRLRIALCGYDGEHEMPADWVTVRWQAQGGYGCLGDGRGRANAARETIWFSPHCIPPERTLLDVLEDADD